MQHSAGANGSERMNKPAARGFTLIEILVVVVIIGILGAVIVPNLLGRPDQARVTAAQSDLRALSAALNASRATIGTATITNRLMWRTD